MIRLSLVLTSLGAIAALAQEGAEASSTKPRLTVIPFAALTADVPQRAGAKAVGMLTTEFKSADSFTLVEPKKEKAGSTDEALEPARAAVNEAKELRNKRKFRLAQEALQKALAAYKATPASAAEVGELVDAYALLSAVQYNTGKDEDGAKSLKQALALAPDRELPLAQTSALFARVVADARKALKEGPKGSLQLESSPSNAPVVLDGLAVGSTPISVKEVPPGLHYWRATLPSGEAVGGVIEVTAGKQASAKATSATKDPESRLLASLAQNRLDADLVSAAKEHAKASEAEMVVFGALSNEGKGLALDTFLYTATSGDLRRMARTSFDAELLSAGMEFFNLAGELAKKGDKVGEGVKVPASVSLSLVTGGATKAAEVKFGVIPGKDLGVEGLEPGAEGKDDGPRKPLEQKRRGPLKRQ